MKIGDLQCIRLCLLLSLIFINCVSCTTSESQRKGFYIRCDGENGVDVAEVVKGMNIKLSDLCWEGPKAMVRTMLPPEIVQFSVDGVDIGGVIRIKEEKVNVSASFVNYTLHVPYNQPCGRMDLPVKAMFSTNSTPEVRNRSLHFHVKCDYKAIDLALSMTTSPNKDGFNNTRLEINDGKTWIETFSKVGVDYITGWVENNGNGTLPFTSSGSPYFIVSYITKSSSALTDYCYDAFGTWKNMYHIGPTSTLLWAHTFQNGLGPGESYNFSHALSQVLRESIHLQDLQMCGPALLVTAVDPFNVANETSDMRRCNNFVVLNVSINCDSNMNIPQYEQTCNVHPDSFDAGSAAVLTFQNGNSDEFPKIFKFEYSYNNSSIARMNYNEFDKRVMRKMGAIKVLKKVLEDRGELYNCSDEELEPDNEDDDMFVSGTEDKGDDMSAEEIRTYTEVNELMERAKNASLQELKGIIEEAVIMMTKLNVTLTDGWTMKAVARRQAVIGAVWGLQALAGARIGNMYSPGTEVATIGGLACNAAQLIKLVKNGITSEYMNLVDPWEIQNGLNKVIQVVSAASIVIKTAVMAKSASYGCANFLDMALDTLMALKEHIANNTVMKMNDNWIIQKEHAYCDEAVVMGKISPCLQKLLSYCLIDKCEKITEPLEVQELVCQMKRLSDAIRAGYKGMGLRDVEDLVISQKGWYKESGCPNPFAPKRCQRVIWERDGNKLMSGHLLWDGRICWKTAAVCKCNQCPQSSMPYYGSGHDSMYDYSTPYPGLFDGFGFTKH